MSRTEASLIGEFSIEYLFQATPGLAFRIAYELLGLTDVGLATNSPQLTNRLTEDVAFSLPYIGAVFVY